MSQARYSIIIQWSAEDDAFVATLPEWGGAHTHSDSYEGAARQAGQLLEELIEAEQAAGRALPPPHGFLYPGPSGYTYDLHAAMPIAVGSLQAKKSRKRSFVRKVRHVATGN